MGAMLDDIAKRTHAGSLPTAYVIELLREIENTGLFGTLKHERRSRAELRIQMKEWRLMSSPCAWTASVKSSVKFYPIPNRRNSVKKIALGSTTRFGDKSLSMYRSHSSALQQSINSIRNFESGSEEGRERDLKEAVQRASSCETRKKEPAQAFTEQQREPAVKRYRPAFRYKNRPSKPEIATINWIDFDGDMSFSKFFQIAVDVGATHFRITGKHGIYFLTWAQISELVTSVSGGDQLEEVIFISGNAPE